jgi:hypothetical protein
LDLILRSDTGEEPEISQAIDYARVMLERFQRLEGTQQPDLGLKVLRVLDEVLRTKVTPDLYYRLDGTDERRPGETPERQASRLASYQDATNVYNFFFRLPGDLRYTVRLFQFDSEQEAEEFIAPENLPSITILWDDAEVVDSDLAVDGEAMLVSYTYSGDPSGVAETGYAYFARFGSLVLRIGLANPAGDVPQAAVERLAEQQVACLTATEPCAPIIYTDDLIAA